MGVLILRPSRKHETIPAEGMADRIIDMYAFGTSTREISRYFEREFNTRLSAETISAVTIKFGDRFQIMKEDSSDGECDFYRIPRLRSI